MIEFESVSKTFRDGTTAVDNLSLVVPSGKITVIVGPSGCGKTTTLRMVNRMLEPSKGKISWDGKPIKSRRKTALRRQMGYVIQSGGLFPHRTVLENIATVPGLLGWDRTKSHKRAVELLGSVGLERSLGGRYPAQLSGGQQQRIGVARALAADPQVLLMDEPFSAVDPVVRGELQEFFLDLQRQLSKTIIMITHDIDEAIRLGDQVAVLRVGGRVAQVGTPQELLDEPADGFVEGFVGKDRGYRALSFQPASGLPVGSVQVVRDAGYGAANGPTLVVNADAQPGGWVNPSRPGSTIALGATFDPERDSLRNALDAALTSPVGLAVAVTGPQRRYAGVVNADMILTHVTRTRAQIAESIAVRAEDIGPRAEDAAVLTDDTAVRAGHAPSGAPDHTSVGAEGAAAGDEDASARVEETAVRPGDSAVRAEDSAPRTGDPAPTYYPPATPADWDDDPEVTSVRGVPIVGAAPPVAAVSSVTPVTPAPVDPDEPATPEEPVAAAEDPEATRISGPLPEDIETTPSERLLAEDVPGAEEAQPDLGRQDQDQPADSDDHDRESPR